MVAERKSKNTPAPKREPVVTIAKVTSKGQITLPKSIRESLGIDYGDSVAFLRDEDGVRIQRNIGASPFKRWRGHLSDLKGVDIDRLVDEMRGR